jgi:nucleotide-binding universal stress UspA family protein
MSRPGTFAVTAEEDRADAEQYMQAIADRLRSDHLETESRVVAGNAADEILAAAADASASLIVMPTATSSSAFCP